MPTVYLNANIYRCCDNRSKVVHCNRQEVCSSSGS